MPRVEVDACVPAMPIQNAEIAALLSQEAELLEIQGANPFRVRAYRRAAQTIDALPRSVASILAAGEDLTALPGIGQDLASKIAEIVKTGHFAALDDLKREVPGELAAIAALPGMGPKRVSQLHHELGVRTLDDLRRAVEGGRLHGLKGFGARIGETLRTALAKPPAETRYKLSSVEQEVDALISFLKPTVGGGRIAAAGSFRRRKDTVGDLDLLATSNDAAAVGARLAAYENVGPAPSVMATNSNPIRVAPAVPAMMKKLSQPWSIGVLETEAAPFVVAPLDHCDHGSGRPRLYRPGAAGI